MLPINVPEFDIRSKTVEFSRSVIIRVGKYLEKITEKRNLPVEFISLIPSPHRSDIKGRDEFGCQVGRGDSLKKVTQTLCYSL